MPRQSQEMTESVRASTQTKEGEGVGTAPRIKLTIFRYSGSGDSGPWNVSCIKAFPNSPYHHFLQIKSCSTLRLSDHLKRVSSGFRDDIPECFPRAHPRMGSQFISVSLRTLYQCS